MLLSDSALIDDVEIEETLWYYYFDIPRTVSWLSGFIFPLFRKLTKQANIRRP
jgi:hypothetical protein